MTSKQRKAYNKFCDKLMTKMSKEGYIIPEYKDEIYLMINEEKDPSLIKAKVEELGILY